MSKLAYLRDVLGFDLTTVIPFGGGWRPRCSQCAALVINGIACHETGCPHATKACKGCDARIPARAWVTYCPDCQ